jgi:hypothetical protein
VKVLQLPDAGFAFLLRSSKLCFLCDLLWRLFVLFLLGSRGWKPRPQERKRADIQRRRRGVLKRAVSQVDLPKIGNLKS